MRIAMVAPVFSEIPARKTGPIQGYIELLSSQLQANGHNVSILAPGNSTSPLSLHTGIDVPEDPSASILDTVYPELSHAVRAYDLIESIGFDVVHDHTMAGPVVAASRGGSVVHTLHRALTNYSQDLFARLDGVAHVALSDSQASSCSSLGDLTRIYSAVDLRRLEWSRSKDPFVFFMGRMSAHKGAHLALQAARLSNLPIVLMGRVREPSEVRYFHDVVKPLLGPNATYLGEGSTLDCNRIALKASAVLFPAQWEEPFGLVMAEAAAAGTPVVALNHGAASEVVQHGRSGILVEDGDDVIADLATAIERCGAELDPSECRRVAEERFSPVRLATEYVEVYEQAAPRAKGSGVKRPADRP